MPNSTYFARLAVAATVAAALGIGIGNASLAFAADRDTTPAVRQASGLAAGKLVLLRDTESRVEVDAGGKVVAVHSDPALPAVVAEALAANIRKVAFAPPLKDGLPVSGVTYVWQDACAAPIDGAYRFAVKFIGNGPSLKVRAAPGYPIHAMRGRESASFSVEYDVATDGSVSMHAAHRKDESQRFTKDFTKEIESWVERQRFEPEQLAGAPVGTRITTEVDFTLDSKRVDKRKDLAANASCQAALSGPPAKSRRVALNSPFRPLAAD